MTWDAAAIAWVAGIIEGEGTIGFQARTSVSVQVGMTDEDVVRRLHEVTGVGNVSGPRLRSGGRKSIWFWYVSERSEVERLLRAIEPWLGQRRRTRVAGALERLINNRGAASKRTHCPRGHEYTPENTYRHPRGDRQCRACHALWKPQPRR